MSVRQAVAFRVEEVRVEKFVVLGDVVGVAVGVGRRIGIVVRNGFWHLRWNLDAVNVHVLFLRKNIFCFKENHFLF